MAPDNLPWMWPFSAVAEAATGLAEQMGWLAEPPAAAAPLPWTTDNRIVLDLPQVRLRDFSTPGPHGRRPLLIAAPFAVHTAVVADLAPGHSLVAALKAAGCHRLHLVDWKSATTATRGGTIDDYLAILNVLVDDIGPPLDILGLCQGGWLALLYAARFPDKVGALVLAGAPVDTSAGPGMLAEAARATPIGAFRDLVAMHGGRMPGRLMQQRWPTGDAHGDKARDSLQHPAEPGDAAGRAAVERFAAWDEVVFDLPGPYYLEVVEWLFQDNRIATGRFDALGRRVDLAALRQPLFLLAGADDDIAPPAQVFAAADLVGTPKRDVRTQLAASNHLGLFMGRETLATVWPAIVAWLHDRDGRSRAAPAGQRMKRSMKSAPRPLRA